jgi:hypothetical protein
MIEITLKLDDEAVKVAVQNAWQREFTMPGASFGRSEGGAGWKEVMRQVSAHIETMDLSAAIALAARSKIAGVVDEAVTIALRERAKRMAKEMANNGTLLAETK